MPPDDVIVTGVHGAEAQHRTSSAVGRREGVGDRGRQTPSRGRNLVSAPCCWHNGFISPRDRWNWPTRRCRSGSGTRNSERGTAHVPCAAQQQEYNFFVDLFLHVLHSTKRELEKNESNSATPASSSSSSLWEFCGEKSVMWVHGYMDIWDLVFKMSQESISAEEFSQNIFLYIH